MRFRFLTRALATAALFTGLVASAQDKPAGKAKQPAMDEKAAMEAMEKAGAPGDAHKKLEAMVGTFDVKVKMWMDASKPPEESTGSSENSWVLGNRFVEMKYQGTMMGKPFNGIGYTGYDNVTKKYVGSWMNDESTGMMVSKGTMSGNVMNSTATASDAMTGKVANFTEKVTVTDNDHHTMEMWGPGPDGKNYKMMEINYTRKQ